MKLSANLEEIETGGYGETIADILRDVIRWEIEAAVREEMKKHRAEITKTVKAVMGGIDMPMLRQRSKELVDELIVTNWGKQK